MFLTIYHKIVLSGSSNMLRLIICVFCAISFGFMGECEGQVLGTGECPAVEVVENFEASKYTGLWYEYERYPLIFEFLGKCVTATYTAQDDGKIGVFNQQVNALLGNTQDINGTASFEGLSNVAKLIVTFSSFFSVKGSYWVLGTDYTNYSVVWSCTKLGYVNLISAWVLTREAKPSQEIINEAHKILEKNKVSLKHFAPTDQTNCPKRTQN